MRTPESISKSKIEKILAITRKLNADDYRDHDITSGTSIDDILKELNFYLKKHLSNKKKINRIIEHVSKLSTGNFSERLTISKEENELDVM